MSYYEEDDEDTLEDIKAVANSAFIIFTVLVVIVLAILVGIFFIIRWLVCGG